MLRSTYKIFDKNNLIIEHHDGIVTSETFISFKLKLAKDPKFRRNFNFLVDLRDVVFDSNIEELNTFADFMNSYEEELGQRKIATLTKTPNQVVSSTLYQSVLKKEINDLRIFTTVEEALKFLNVGDTQNDFFKSSIQLLRSKNKGTSI